MTMASPTMINGERIRQAREIGGLTQEQLANKLKLSQAQVTYFEQNLREPKEETLDQIALATSFPISFFRRESGPELALGSLLYRKRKSMSSRERDQVLQLGRIILEATLELGESFRNIDLKLPRISEATPQDAARITRAELGFSPDRPITNLMTRLERNGVIIIPVALQIDEHDAFSVWSNTEPRKPVIVMTSGKPGDRQRWSLSHELGHLVMHYAYRASIADIEMQANQFASEFLIPEEMARKEFKPPLTLTFLAEIKSRWGIAIQALIQRAFQLDIITDGQRRYLFRQLASRGWLRNEPVPIPTEKPRLLRKMIEATYGNKIDIKTMADRICVSAGMMREIFDSYRPAINVARQQAPQPKLGRLLTMPKPKQPSASAIGEKYAGVAE